MHARTSLLAMAVALGLAACATRQVRQQNLAAWVDMPVEALDTHLLFLTVPMIRLTVPMIRTKTESGIEIRNYANGINMSSCSGSAGANRIGNWVNANALSSCTSGWVGCNNIFYIKDSKVIEYAPTGRCYTDETVQPQPRYQRLKGAATTK
jgi:hypothetical protein